MQPVVANRSSLIPPDSRLAPPLQAPASQSPAPTERFSSFQLDLAGVGGDAMQAPVWLQSGGQVDYTNMTQHVLQAKRSLQVCLVVTQITVLSS